ncbi:MAG: TetR/AcrR family transcriptional regulator [Candidatus Dormibacteraeota bacterium]|nr:TetR/AcrR family transcriptional regulator [Candidatus Dormibacteraeota bacterium]
MKRGKYQLKRRAEREAETRNRIVEAAVALHAEVGPARTTISAIAELAGVRRPTVYRHFPDEVSLFRACSTHGLTIYPLPDPEPWLEVPDPVGRLRTALGELYPFYRRHERRLSNILRDSEAMPDLQEVNAVVFLPRMQRMHEVLAAAWAAQGRLSTELLPMLGLVLNFYTWRFLALQTGMADSQAVEVAVGIVDCASQRRWGEQPDPLAGHQAAPPG